MVARPPSLLQSICRFSSSAATAAATADQQLVAQATRELAAAITPQVATVLGRRGAAVVDNAVSPAVASALRDEFRALRTTSPDLLRPNCTHFVDGPTAGGQFRLLPKHGILEAEATLDPEARSKLPLWRALSDDGALRALLSVHLNEALATLDDERRRKRRRQSLLPPPPPLRLDNQTVKLQANDGSGGCFPIHVDAAEDLGRAGGDQQQQVDGRVVTCILYLSPSEGYDAARHGGQLRLFPLLPPAARTAVDVLPLEGRLVLFSSARMPHRVLPARGGRIRECATFWLGRGPAAAVTHARGLQAQFWQSEGGGGGGVPLPLEAQLARLLSPRLRPLAARVLLADEWEASLLESHAPGPERDAALERHRRELETARSALAGRMGLSDAIEALSADEEGGGGAASAAAAVEAARAAALDMAWF
jgi:hypothetical protein